MEQQKKKIRGKNVGEHIKCEKHMYEYNKLNITFENLMGNLIFFGYSNLRVFVCAPACLCIFPFKYTVQSLSGYGIQTVSVYYDIRYYIQIQLKHAQYTDT